MCFTHKCVSSKTDKHCRNGTDHHIMTGTFAERAGNKRDNISAQENARTFKRLEEAHCSGKVFTLDSEAYVRLQRRYRYHYTILGLPFLLFGKPFYQKNHYTCSSYAAELLEKAGVCTWNKHFSLVTPKDFYEYKGKQKIFEGSLRELTEREKKTYPEYGTLTFPPISRPAYLSAAGNYITMAHVHNVREEERKGRRRRYER